MSHKLKISDHFSLPMELVTSTQAILAKRRVGKSYTASVQAEEMLKAQQQVVVIDPTGAWWGLKSSADGKSAGFPIAVFGGEHADVPLEESAGEIVASAIVADRFSAIIDLSIFRKGQMNRFMAVFLETLYRLNRQAMHLFVDEADALAPQKVFGDEARTLGAMQDVVRRGGIRGIGCTLITQRPAVLNKDVLTQCEVLTALRLVHPRDIDAVMEWVNVHGDPKIAKQMVDSLPSLPVGTAWVWSPGLDIFERIEVRKRETFDSGATPKPGQSIKPPKVLASVDVKKLGQQIVATVERVKQNDPKVLKAKIAELEKQLAARPKERVEKIVEKIVEVPVLKNGQLDRTEKIADRMQQHADRFAAEAAELRRLIAPAAAPRPASPAILLTRVGQVARTKPDRPRLVPRDSGAVATGTLAIGQRKILTACIQYPDGVTREQLTVLTGYKRSSRDTYLQRLRESQLIEISGETIRATQAGVDLLGDVEPLPTGDSLREHWRARLPQGELAIFDVLVAAYPDAVPRDAISERTNYLRSSRDTYLQRMNAKRLIQSVGRGEVKASDQLF